MGVADDGSEVASQQVVRHIKTRSGLKSVLPLFIIVRRISFPLTTPLHHQEDDGQSTTLAVWRTFIQCRKPLRRSSPRQYPRAHSVRQYPIPRPHTRLPTTRVRRRRREAAIDPVLWWLLSSIVSQSASVVSFRRSNPRFTPVPWTPMPLEILMIVQHLLFPPGHQVLILRGGVGRRSNEA